MEGAGREGQSGRLFAKRSNEFRMTVAMVEGRGSGVKVEIMIALGIPDVGSLSAREYNGQRLVVFGGEVLLCQEGRAAGGSVIRIDVLTVGTVGTVSTVYTVGHDAELWW